MRDSFGAKGVLTASGSTYGIYRLAACGPAVDRLPMSLKVLLENLLRHEDGRVVRREQVEALLTWDAGPPPRREIAFHPARVLLQDFTGVPAVVDLTAMREAVARMGGDPDRVNPQRPADLVIDHSIQVDRFGTLGSLAHNARLDHARNRERYAFLRWGQRAFTGLGVVPPHTGICHQVNLEHLASVVMVTGGVAHPDTLVGTDSHTTMINGLGVLGWGAGGIEAEAAMLGQPLTLMIPDVVGVRLRGALREGATATDLVLTLTELLRKRRVVGKFVELFGAGLDALSLPDRATVANMAPEYGATMGFCPIDAETLAYLRFTGRPRDLVALVEAYSKEQGLFRDGATPEPSFSETLDLDLADVVPSLAGPRRPQDRVPLVDVQRSFRAELAGVAAKDFAAIDRSSLDAWLGGAAASDAITRARRATTIAARDTSYHVKHGSVVIAAITSCTNTSNPAVLLGAGLLARKAVERGLSTRPWVKTSLAPGSRVVTEYLREAGLLPYLEALGFHVVGYGCTTCIGNSGPLPAAVAEAVRERDLVVAAVLSGNRNFEGRVNPDVRMNYLASPPLVIAYALAGDLDVDLATEPIGADRNGELVYLRDLWPSNAEVRAAITSAVRPEQFQRQYAAVLEGDESWAAIEVPSGRIYAWDPRSTYVRRPPFFDDLPREPAPREDLRGARCLLVLGDSVTTDHISPAGNIGKDSPAARYLIEQGVLPRDFNSYGARRGNHEVMVRGTFANIRLRNLMLAGKEGPRALHLPTGDELSVFDAAMRYAADETPLIVLAGAEYGTGSSRDWAAKGTRLLGVRAVIARSFERIHRSNLIGMGVLPLELDAGQSAGTLGLTGREVFTIEGIAEDLAPRKRLTVRAASDGGAVKSFEVTARIDTPNELDYYQHDGLLPFVLRRILG